jgi:hypothetical protein
MLLCSHCSTRCWPPYDHRMRFRLKCEHSVMFNPMGHSSLLMVTPCFPKTPSGRTCPVRCMGSSRRGANPENPASETDIR